MNQRATIARRTARRGVFLVLVVWAALPAFAHEGSERHPLPEEWKQARADLDELETAVNQLRQTVESMAVDPRDPGSAPAMEIAERALAAVEQMGEQTIEQPVAEPDILARWLGGSAAAASVLALLLGVLRNRRLRPRDTPDDTEPRPPEADDEKNTAPQKEKTDMPKVIETESKLRFEIREAEDGHPYFALVFTSNGNVLMASESYASGMDALQHAMGRARRETAGAAEEDVRHKGPIPGAAPGDR